MHIFYSYNINNEYCILNGDEANHCLNVLRLKCGDKVGIIDGVGTFYEGEIYNVLHKECIVKILSKKDNFEKRKYYLHIAIAPPKNIDRIEFFIEKATEIGIDEITPLLCNNSERTKINVERLQKISIAAAKQSIKAYIPSINNLCLFKDFIEKNAKDNDSCKFIAHCYDKPKKNIKQLYSSGDSAIVLIGPEGDFSLDEVTYAVKNGFKEITLNKSRLRTETAAIVVCTYINLLNDE
jgi:16S rRNA (uracil1498-N3)-methyltransferase